MRHFVLTILLLMTACAAGPEKPEPVGRAVEEALLESDQVIRVDVSEDWYWLVTADFGLLSAIGRERHEARLDDGKYVPTRLMGIEGHGTLVEYDERPDGLDWIDEEASLLNVEFPLMPLAERYERAAWTLPRVTGRTTGEEPHVFLSQSAEVETRLLSVLHHARRFREAGEERVAYWGIDRTEKTAISRVDRLRYFDPHTPEWDRIVRVLNIEGLGSGEFDGEAAAAGGMILAGEFGFPLG